MRFSSSPVRATLTLTLLVGAVPVGQAAAQSLTIVTFNAEFLTRPRVHIKFGLPFNLANADPAVVAQWNQPGFRDQRFNEAAQAVAQVIASIDADVVAMTEVGNDADVAELVAEIQALGVAYPHTAVCGCTDHTTAQHVAVLSKIPLSNAVPALPGREHYYEELDDPNTEEDTGISKGMRVTFAAEGQDFHLYVLHLASERFGHEQDQQRISQASIVRRHYLPRLQTGAHVIVTGDLNDGRGQPALRRIRGFDDIEGDLIQTGNVEYFDAGQEGTRWTYAFQGVRNQIDHILLSRSIRESWRIDTMVPDQTDPLASDHRPLIVTLELR
jgi:endonuclease/exonuclease/phosphatase family metal-dependent hydrolase